MCSEYHTPKNPGDIEKSLGLSIENNATQFEWGSVMKFHKEGAVIQKRPDGGLELALKTFPVNPMPNSRLSGLQGQTDANSDTEIEDEQVERIYDKRTWMAGFKNHPLLVPASRFLEFAYWGPEMGSALGFTIPNEKVLFIGAIAIKPYTPAGKEFSGYSLLTHQATEQMLDYHQRLLVLFEPKMAAGYLEDMNESERFDYVIKNRYIGPLIVEKVRHMAKGWEKRVETQERKLRQELKYRAVLKSNDIEG